MSPSRVIMTIDRVQITQHVSGQSHHAIARTALLCASSRKRSVDINASDVFRIGHTQVLQPSQLLKPDIHPPIHLDNYANTAEQSDKRKQQEKHN